MCDFNSLFILNQTRQVSVKVSSPNSEVDCNILLLISVSAILQHCYRTLLRCHCHSTPFPSQLVLEFPLDLVLSSFPSNKLCSRAASSEFEEILQSSVIYPWCLFFFRRSLNNLSPAARDGVEFFTSNKLRIVHKFV